jgi:hypothetical protein
MRARTKDDYQVILEIRGLFLISHSQTNQQFYAVEPSLAQPRKELG